MGTKNIYVHDPKKDKKVKAGMLVNDTFIKVVYARHLMRKEKGYGIQVSVLKELKVLNCTNILIIFKDMRYTSKLKDWTSQPIKDYGHGGQRFLAINKMEKTYVVA